MSEHYLIAAQGVLGIRSPIPSIKWSYGALIPEGTRQEWEACAVRMTLEVGPIEELRTADLERGKYHYFSAIPEADTLYYDRAFWMKRRIQLKFTGLLTNTPVLRANSDYKNFISHRFMNLHSVGYILTDMAGHAMLREGYAALHCSAFQTENATVIVYAPPNTGKTLTAATACMQRGANYLAEDLAISDGKMLYSVPWTSTFRYYEDIDPSRWNRWVYRATEKVPVLELLPLGKVDAIDHYIPSERIIHSAKPTHLVMLERGPTDEIVEVSADETLRRIVNLNRYEFMWMRAPSLVAHEFFNPDMDLVGAVAKERKILKKLVKTVDHTWVIRTPDPTRYADMILERLR